MQDPPWPYFSSSSVMTSTALSAVLALSSASLEKLQSHRLMFYLRLAQQRLGHTNTLLLPDKIHAEKSLVPISTLSAPHRFIPNTHLMLIGTHLCPPQPGWFAQHDCISVWDLLDLYVCTLLTGGPRHRGGQHVNGCPGSSVGKLKVRGQ